ncbi:MAG: hypothetical protein M1815_003026 [Lichina confinis]|nr:MAG: hypothetical protein M1815_003026 [Lichina confinis]
MPRKTKSAAPSMPPTLAAAKKPSNVTSKPAMSSEKVVDSDIESDLSDSSTSLPFSRSLRLQRVPTSAPLAPPTDQEPEPLTSPVKAAPRVARPQPPRLKMRYRPFGAAESESDDEASESGAQNSGSVEGTRFRIPVGFEDVVENRKRKHDANGTCEDDMPNGHRKKVKRVSFVDSEVAPSTTAAAQGLMHSPMPDSSPAEKEKAKQEKRDRKQERRKAREARRSEHNEDMGMDLGGTNGQIEQSNEQMGEQRHGSQEQERKHHIPSKNQSENGALGGPDAAEKRAKKERRREKRRKDKEEGVGSTKGGPARRKTEKKEKKDKRHREKIQIDGRA